MRSLLAKLLLAGAAALAGCQFCSEPTHYPVLVDQPLGALCGRATECAAGLDCLDRTCTVPCPDGTCAVGVCFDHRYCLAGCAGDADCQLGAMVGSCNLLVPPEASYCFPRDCTADADCPQGRCAGVSKASGITWNEYCSNGTCVR